MSEALDWTLLDFKGNLELMGDSLVVLSGDFLEMLPVIAKYKNKMFVACCNNVLVHFLIRTKIFGDFSHILYMLMGRQY